jgi:hypothetical protein
VNEIESENNIPKEDRPNTVKRGRRVIFSEPARKKTTAGSCSYVCQKTPGGPWKSFQKIYRKKNRM